MLLRLHEPVNKSRTSWPCWCSGSSCSVLSWTRSESNPSAKNGCARTQGPRHHPSQPLGLRFGRFTTSKSLSKARPRAVGSSSFPSPVAVNSLVINSHSSRRCVEVSVFDSTAQYRSLLSGACRSSTSLNSTSSSLSVSRLCIVFPSWHDPPSSGIGCPRRDQLPFRVGDDYGILTSHHEPATRTASDVQGIAQRIAYCRD